MNNIQITFIMKDDGHQEFKSSFPLSEGGFIFITYLTQMKDPQGMYYKLCRDFNCTRSINYLELSQDIRDLNLPNPAVIYVKKESQPDMG